MTAFNLSERQRSIAALALSLISILIVGAVILGGLWLLGLFLSAYSTVILPIAVAGIIALVMKPYYEWILSCVKGHVGVALLLLFLSILIPLIGISWFFGALIVSQLAGLASKLVDLIRSAWLWMVSYGPGLLERFQEHEWDGQAQEFLGSRVDLFTNALLGMGQSVLSAGASIFQLGAAIIGWFILPIYLGFFLIARVPSRDKAEANLPFLKPETRNTVVFLAAEFVNILVSFFRGQLMISLLQGLLYAVGFTVVGLQYGFVLGLLLGIFNIVPYLGSMIGLAIALPLAFLQTGGGWTLVLLVFGVFTVVQLIESYFLTPRIMGKRTGLHPLVIIIAIFFWGSVLGGIIGMILAIPLTAFLVVLWRLLKEKYIREIV